MQLSLHCLGCLSLYFKKQHWNRLRENSKIRHFVISSHLFYWHANHIKEFFLTGIMQPPETKWSYTIIWQVRVFMSKLCDRNNSIQKPTFTTFGVLTLSIRLAVKVRQSRKQIMVSSILPKKTSVGTIFSTVVIWQLRKNQITTIVCQNLPVMTYLQFFWPYASS